MTTSADYENTIESWRNDYISNRSTKKGWEILENLVKMQFEIAQQMDTDDGPATEIAEFDDSSTSKLIKLIIGDISSKDLLADHQILLLEFIPNAHPNILRHVVQTIRMKEGAISILNTSALAVGIALARRVTDSETGEEIARLMAHLVESPLICEELKSQLNANNGKENSALNSKELLNLKDTLDWHQNYSIWECSLCEFKTYSPLVLKNHVIKCTEDKADLTMFECPFCSKNTYKSLPAFKRHVNLAPFKHRLLTEIYQIAKSAGRESCLLSDKSWEGWSPENILMAYRGAEFNRQNQTSTSRCRPFERVKMLTNPVNVTMHKATVQYLPSRAMKKQPIRLLVTGAAGQIGYSIVIRIADGTVFGKEQPVEIVLLDAAHRKPALEEIRIDIHDCALPTLHSVLAVTDEKSAFTGVDYAFLVGAMPRSEGTERKDLLAANVKIFKSQGKALAEYAKPTTKVIVVGRQANTNAFIAAKYAAGKIPAKNFSAMTRLDHNRALAQLALKTGTTIGDVKNVIIWGNHSSTQFPDVTHATVNKNGFESDAYSAVGDNDFLQGAFITTVQKKSENVPEEYLSAMPTSKAACDHLHDWHFGTKAGEFVSMAVPSDGSYGIPQGLVFSFPVKIHPVKREWKIVQGLNFDDFARGKIAATTKELEEERDDALKACDDANI